MSYPKDLEEYSDQELLREVERRFGSDRLPEKSVRYSEVVINQPKLHWQVAGPQFRSFREGILNLEQKTKRKP